MQNKKLYSTYSTPYMHVGMYLSQNGIRIESITEHCFVPMESELNPLQSIVSSNGIRIESITEH